MALLGHNELSYSKFLQQALFGQQLLAAGQSALMFENGCANFIDYNQET